MGAPRAEWVIAVEKEEGIPIHEVIKRERSFGIPDATIADSFEVERKTYHAFVERLRKKGLIGYA